MRKLTEIQGPANHPVFENIKERSERLKRVDENTKKLAELGKALREVNKKNNMTPPVK